MIKIVVLVVGAVLCSCAAWAQDRIRPICEETATNRHCWVPHPEENSRVAPMPLPPPLLPPSQQELSWRARVPPELANYYCYVGVARYC